MQRLYSRKFVRQLGGMRLDGFALCIEAQGLPLLLCTRAFAEACGCTGGGRSGIVPNDGRCSSPSEASRARPPGGKWGAAGAGGGSPCKTRAANTAPRPEATLLELLHPLTKWTSPQLCATVEAAVSERKVLQTVVSARAADGGAAPTAFFLSLAPFDYHRTQVT